MMDKRDRKNSGWMDKKKQLSSTSLCISHAEIISDGLSKAVMLNLLQTDTRARENIFISPVA